MCLQERRPCEEADGVPRRYSAAAQATRRAHSTGCARCRLHEQHSGNHQEISDKAPQTFHQRNRFVAARRFCNFLQKIIEIQLQVSFFFLLLLQKKQTTDLISEENLDVIAELTGCTPQRRPPSCKTTPNLNIFRTASSVCNNRWGRNIWPTLFSYIEEAGQHFFFILNNKCLFFSPLSTLGPVWGIP